MYTRLPKHESSSHGLLLGFEWCHQAEVEEYRSQMHSFLETKLYFTPEDLENEHLRLKLLIFSSAKTADSETIETTRETASEVDEMFSYFKQDNVDNLNRCNQLKSHGARHCITKFNEIQKAFCTDIIASPVGYFDREPQEASYGHFNQFTALLPLKWGSYMNEWYRSETDKFLADVDHVTSIIRQYTDDFQEFFRENVCVEPQVFDETHTIYLEKARNSDESWDYKWTGSDLRGQLYSTVQIIRNLFSNDNHMALEMENEILAQALSHAQNRYNKAMTLRITGSSLTTKAEIKDCHDSCKTAVVESFTKVPSFTYSHLWNKKQNNLEHSLELYLDKLLDRNNDVIVDKSQRSEVNINSVVDNFPVTVPFPKPVPVPVPAPVPLCTPRTTANNFDITTGGTIKAANKPYGLGIFIGPVSVHVGIYKSKNKAPIYLEFPPFITFKNTEIRVFQEGSYEQSDQNFNIIRMLEEADKDSKSVLILNQPVSLRTEEIVGLFLHRIKSEAGRAAKQDLKSCVVAASGLWSTSSKQMLKNSLFLSGFERNELIQSTTSIGLSYLLHSQDHNHKDNHPNDYVALIHQNPTGFDVSIATVSKTTVLVEKLYTNENLETALAWYNPLRLCRFLLYILMLLGLIRVRAGAGDGDRGDSTSNNSLLKVKKIVASLLASLNRNESHLSHVVYIRDKSQKTTPTEEGETKYMFNQSELIYLADEQKGLVLGAAALSALHCGNLDVKNLTLKELIPYTLTSKINDQAPHIMATSNTPLVLSECLLPAADGKISNVLSIYELVRGKENLIGSYAIDLYRSNMGRQKFEVMITAEGLVEVQLQRDNYTNPASLRVQTNFMTLSQLRNASANISSIIRLIYGVQN